MSWRFFTANLVGGALLEELPLSDTKFRLELNKAGSLTAKINLGELMASSSSTKTSKSSILLGATTPAKTALYVERDGVIVWAGIIWKRKYERVGRVISLGAGTFESYYAHRRFDGESQYINHEQLSIFRDFANYCHASGAGSDIGITVPTLDNGINTAASGVLRDRYYPGIDRKLYSELFDQLASLQDGFDWAVDVTWSGSTIVRNLNLSYPRRGRFAYESGIVFDSDRNLIDYDVDEFGEKATNRVFGVGQGDGVDSLQSTASRPDLIDLGYPLLDGLFIEKSISEQSTLDGKVTQLAADYGAPPTQLSLTVRGDVEPEIGTWIVGDDVRVVIRPDERFPAGVDSYYRILAADFTVDGNASETVDLTVEAAS